MNGELTFLPIQLPTNADICLQFTTDAFVCSFGDDSRFLCGTHHYLRPDQYLRWLQSKVSSDPESAVHVWMGSEIIGQMELGAYRHDPTVGYVHLYYLVPHARGKHLSEPLDRYASTYLSRKGYSRAFLSVTKSNERARRYYQKMGWKESGPSPDDPEVVIMEKGLTPPNVSRL